MKRYDPIQYLSQGGSTYGDMVQREDGDYYNAEDVADLLRKMEPHLRHSLNCPGRTGMRCECGSEDARREAARVLNSSEQAVTPAPFDLLMRQIETMRDRARQYAEESEAEQNYEDGHRHRSVEGTLNELHRLGNHFNSQNDLAQATPTENEHDS